MIVSQPQLHYVDGLNLQGNCGYRIEGSHVFVTVESIASNRDFENLSGSLTMELWATRSPFDGQQLDGVVTAETALGELQGQHFLPACEYDLMFNEPPVGNWNMSLVLREWTENGYEVRDYVNFEVPYVVSWQPVVIEADFGKQADEELEETQAEATEVEAKKAPEVEAKKAPAVEAKKAPAVEAKTAAPKAKEESKPAAAKAPAAKAPAAKASAPRPATAAKSPAASLASSALKSAQEKTSAKPAAKAAPVNVNSATAEEIAKLNGISMKVAEAIVLARPYKAVKDLVNVKGMGAKTLKKIESDLTV